MKKTYDSIFSMTDLSYDKEPNNETRDKTCKTEPVV